jgi:hypothetical protein
MKKWKKDGKREFAINPHESAADKGTEARPTSLAENGGDGSSKRSGSAVKVGEGRGFGTPIKRGRPRYTE